MLSLRFSCAGGNVWKLAAPLFPLLEMDMAVDGFLPDQEFLALYIQNEILTIKTAPPKLSIEKLLINPR